MFRIVKNETIYDLKTVYVSGILRNAVFNSTLTKKLMHILCSRNQTENESENNKTTKT